LTRSYALTAIEHRCFVFFALADDDLGVHRRDVEDGAHGFNGSTIAGDLLTTTHPLSGVQCGSFDSANQIKR